MKKSLALALSLIFLLSGLVSCTTEQDPEMPDSDSGETQTQTEPEIEGVLLFKKGEKTEYRVVYEDGLGSNAQSGINYAVDRLNTLFEGIELVAYPVSKCPVEDGVPEILIGETDREKSGETEALFDAENEYIVKLYEDGTLCIVGTDEVMLKKGVTAFMDNNVSSTSAYVALEEGYVDRGTQKKRAGWKLTAPIYQGGEFSESAYDTGFGIDFDTTAGQMQIVRKTDGDEFGTYLEKLTANGYELVAENAINGNRYLQYKKNGVLLYTYYLHALEEVRIIEDTASVSETEFEYTYTPAEGESTVLYQFSMMGSPSGTEKDAELGISYPNNGMFYILRLADNSVVLIDGGTYDHANDLTVQALYDFLYEITGTAKTEKLRIACLYISHAHGDHMSLSIKLIKTYSETLEVERAMYNLPNATGAAPEFGTFTTFLGETYPDIKFIKPHTGQSIRLADATIDVVTAQEDLVDVVTGKTIVDDYNNYTTVIKITANGTSALLLGDWGGNMIKPQNYDDIEKYILAPYKTENGYDFLECDAVQVAHHGFNYWLGKVYAAVKAKTALFPTSDTHNKSMWQEAIPIVVSMTKAAGAERICFYNRYLYELKFTDGGFEVTEKAPIGVTETYLAYLEAHKPIEL